MGKNKAAAKTKRKSTIGNGKAQQPQQKLTALKKLPNLSDPMTKSDIIKTICAMKLLAKKDVAAVLESLQAIIEHHINKKGPGVFVMPGILKVTSVKKPPRPARKGINPFTGEEITIKAKPARNVIKIKPLKKLKEMVA